MPFSCFQMNNSKLNDHCMQANVIADEHTIISRDPCTMKNQNIINLTQVKYEDEAAVCIN